MKVLFVHCIFFLFFANLNVKAQEHETLTNSYWKLLSTRTIKKAPSGDYLPYFPPDLMKINKTKIKLNGYMVPLKSGISHKHFLISVLPVMQCQFCGSGDIPEMVEVFMSTPIKFSTKPIAISGILIINDTNHDKATFELMDAKLDN